MERHEREWKEKVKEEGKCQAGQFRCLTTERLKF